MKKITIALCLVALSFVVPVFAGPAGKSSIIQLDLVQKNPSDWSIVQGGAWGKLTYNKDTGKFVFNGHLLKAGVSYTLINFARVGSEWPATINVLGSGIANAERDVHIAGNYPYDKLGYDTTPGTGSTAGYKIWLVLTSDINAAGKLAGWSPGDYLFEYELI